jgi:hypothetical protein
MGEIVDFARCWRALLPLSFHAPQKVEKSSLKILSTDDFNIHITPAVFTGPSAMFHCFSLMRSMAAKGGISILMPVLLRLMILL